MNITQKYEVEKKNSRSWTDNWSRTEKDYIIKQIFKLNSKLFFFKKKTKFNK